MAEQLHHVKDLKNINLKIEFMQMDLCDNI